MSGGLLGCLIGTLAVRNWSQGASRGGRGETWGADLNGFGLGFGVED